MKLIRIGLTNNSNHSLLHSNVCINACEGLSAESFFVSEEQIANNSFSKPLFIHNFSSNCFVEAKNNILQLFDGPRYLSKEMQLNKNTDHKEAQLYCAILIYVKSGKLSVKDNGSSKTYTGKLLVIAQQNQIRLILYHELEQYVQSVLRGEVPATYHLEAIKAQAICARTYAIHPRVNHCADFCDVCDSYLCCQCFAEGTADSAYQTATEETADKVLTYQNKPILALFSSCAGGHTENYEDCFSNWETNIFPPQPLSYLRGVSENMDSTAQEIMDEKALQILWNNGQPATIDAWSKNFRWHIQMSKQDLESHLHHNIAVLMKQKDCAPFIAPPPSGIFGEILSLKIKKRGRGGTAILLEIDTSRGIWQVKKELIIRSLFRNQNLNLKRLASARVFFKELKEKNGALLNLNIYGLGSGHGVGLQQVGAEGLARQGRNHDQILNHYYTNILIERL